MKFTQINGLKVSRFILGGNPFSGFSHQSPETDMLMQRYYTTRKIKETLRTAESLGVNTLIARTDFHILRLLLEYWDEGGTIQWFAQTCPEVGDHEISINRAASRGAKGCFIHGGVMDLLAAQNKLAEIHPAIELIRQKGMLAGIAGHHPEVFEWAEKNLDVDFYLCSYYNPIHRSNRAEYVSGMKEWFLGKDRKIMTDLIQTLKKPVVHYKVMAAGRNLPEDALIFTTQKMRSIDAVCVGIYTREIPNMLEQNIQILEENWNHP